MDDIKKELEKNERLQRKLEIDSESEKRDFAKKIKNGLGEKILIENRNLIIENSKKKRVGFFEKLFRIFK